MLIFFQPNQEYLYYLQHGIRHYLHGIEGVPQMSCSFLSFSWLAPFNDFAFVIIFRHQLWTLLIVKIIVLIGLFLFSICSFYEQPHEYSLPVHSFWFQCALLQWITILYVFKKQLWIWTTAWITIHSIEYVQL